MQNQRDVYLIHTLTLLGGYEIDEFAKTLLHLTDKSVRLAEFNKTFVSFIQSNSLFEGHTVISFYLVSNLIEPRQKKFAYCLVGKVNVTVVPSPGLLETNSSPP